jgi:hypothetical protein
VRYVLPGRAMSEIVWLKYCIREDEQILLRRKARLLELLGQGSTAQKESK